MDSSKTTSLIAKILVVGLLLAAAVFAFEKIYPLYASPCAQPIRYSIGTFDGQFNLSQADFLNDVSAATKIWDDPLNKQFFVYSPNNPQVKINLVYDYRQQATDQLKTLGYSIENTQSSYNSLKAHYDSLLASYSSQKASLDAETTKFNSDEQAYETQVQYWNNQGGAPKNVADQLNQTYTELNQRAQTINNEKDQVNALVNQINPLVDVLNNLASQLKLNVTSYNNIGSSRGEEFEEGDYVQDSSGRNINIYEFTSQQQLIRLLAHELGHSLGLQHVTDPNAIMYALNQSSDNMATAADLSELKQVCHLK